MNNSKTNLKLKVLAIGFACASIVSITTSSKPAIAYNQAYGLSDTVGGIVDGAGGTTSGTSGSGGHWELTSAADAQSRIANSSDTVPQAVRDTIDNAVSQDANAGVFLYVDANGNYLNQDNAQFQQGKYDASMDVGFDRNSELIDGMTIQDVMDAFDMSTEDLSCFTLQDLQAMAQALQDGKAVVTSSSSGECPCSSGDCPSSSYSVSRSRGHHASTDPAYIDLYGPDDRVQNFTHTFVYDDLTISGPGGGCSSPGATHVKTSSCIAPIGSSCTSGAYDSYSPETVTCTFINNPTPIYSTCTWIVYYTVYYSCNCSTDEDGNESCDTCSRTEQEQHSCQVFEGCSDNWSSSQSESGTITEYTSGTAVNHYRFKLVPEMQKPTSEIGHLGEEIEVQGKVTLEGADGHNTVSNKRDTRIRLFQFTVSPDQVADSSKVTGGLTGANDPCAYYAGKFGGYFGDCSRIGEDFTNYLAPEGMVEQYTAAESLYILSGNQVWVNQAIDPESVHDIDHNIHPSSVTLGANVAVPDNLPVGTKYCVAIAARSSDYGVPNDGLYDLPSTWAVSNAICVSTTKKPNFQVWNGALYTPSGISTSTSRKMVGIGINADNPSDNVYDESRTAVFGSWEEQMVIAGGNTGGEAGKVNGFGSGAYLGYKNRAGASVGALGGDYNFPLTGGTTKSEQVGISPLTIARTREFDAVDASGSSSVGDSGINVSASAKSLLARLGLRYLNASSNPNYKYYHSENDKYLSALGFTNPVEGNGKDDNTHVVHVNGTLYIDQDICYGNNCGDNKLKLANQSLTTDAIAKLPQVLIFADEIKIAPNVKRVDAWLISGNSDSGTTSGDGVIDTCMSYADANGVAGAGTQANGNNKATGYDGCESPLIINGPIFAKELRLNRTSGASHSDGTTYYHEGGSPLNQDLSNDGSISPAEVFNFRADAYLWAYAQAQRFTEAQVTYTRELAPRL